MVQNQDVRKNIDAMSDPNEIRTTAGNTIEEQEPKEDSTKGKSWRFWAIFPSLMVTTLLSAIEVTVVSTAVPTIVHELGVGKNFVWIINSFVLTSTAFVPIIGQLADVWGRRWPMIVSVIIFTVGSAIAGAANNGNVLIVGRAIQGLGCGGLNMLVDLIMCDLVPLKERGKFVSLISVVFAIGLFVGPFVGGTIVEHSSWRWVFWINLPVETVSLILLFVFLRVTYAKAPLVERLQQIDYVGNIFIMGSTTAVLFALTNADVDYSWSDAHILVPLIVGVVGMGLFHAYEASRLCYHPAISPHLFSNRTSSIAFFVTFIHALMTLWTLYFLPVYFQAVLLLTPSRSGVQILPTVFGMIPSANLAGQYLNRTGKYKLLHMAGMFLMAGGLGSLAALDAGSSTAMWVCLQLIGSFGNGIVAASLLPAVQAGLTDDDNASSPSAWTYIRSYGAIWGVTVPATVFNNVFNKYLWQITDPAARAALSDGNAYAYAAPICAFAVLFTMFEKDILLRASVRTNFGIKELRNDTTLA